MSPEIINPIAKGYEGTRVDIWASGVMLIVMMLGCFPYDHEKNPDPNSLEAAYEVLSKQLIQYRKLPQLKRRIDKLSEELLDLLDKILAPAKERITLEQIKQHPWFLQELEPHFAEAEARLDAAQAARDKISQAYNVSESLMEKRNKQIQAMVEEACKKCKNKGRPLVKPLMSVDLRDEAIAMPSGPTTPAQPSA
eukprot:jgi/Botrbrau1/5580/Bobra.97_2s0011.1